MSDIQVSARFTATFNKFKNSFWVLADQTMVSGVNFFTGVLLARFLGMYEFGIYTLVWTIVMFMRSIQSSLILTPMMSIGPKQSLEDYDTYYGSVTGQQIFYSFTLILLFGVYLFVSQFVPGLNLELAICLIVLLVVVQLQDFYRSCLFSRGQLKAAFLNDFISYIGQLFLILLILNYKSLTVINTFWAISFTSLLASILGLFQLGKLSLIKASFLPILKRHWNFGLWSIWLRIFQWVGSQGILLLAGSALGPQSVGGIRACIALGAAVNIVRLGAQNLLPVEAGKMLKEGGPSELVRYLVRTSIPYVGGIGLISLGIVIFSDKLMVLLYGNEYLPYAKYIIYPALTMVVGSFEAILWLYFRSIEDTKILVFPSVVASVISIIMTGLLLSYIGELAVFIGILVDQVISVVLLLAIMNKRGVLGVKR